MRRRLVGAGPIRIERLGLVGKLRDGRRNLRQWLVGERLERQRFIGQRVQRLGLRQRVQRQRNLRRRQLGKRIERLGVDEQQLGVEWLGIVRQRQR